MRKITMRRQMTKTPGYLIKRSDLDTYKKTVTAKRLLLSPEFIHFTPNYANWFFGTTTLDQVYLRFI